jgi:predicted nucleic acid-binding protein
MILAWHRKLVAQKFDGSKQRRPPGRPRVDKDLENWVVKMATENRLWGYDRIAGSLADSGYTISDQTVGNILKRRDVPTAPDRKKTTTWRDFIRTIIIHGVDDASVNWLVEEAKRQGSSVEQAAGQLLRRVLEGERRQSELPTYHDLDALAGTWRKDEAIACLEGIADFEQVDSELWIAATALQHDLAIFSYDRHCHEVAGLLIGSRLADFIF